MKRFKFLPVAIVLVLVVAVVGCTPMREADGDEYYERVSSAPSRIYVDDPYRGTVVLERDPYSGRYYEVNSYGRYYGSRTRGYDPYYNGRNNYPRTRRVYRTPRQTPPPPPTQEQIKKQQENKDEARKRVLGN